MMIGNNYLILGPIEEALKHYKKAYAIRHTILWPEQWSAGLLMRIGQSYLNIGKDETAAYYLNRARELYNELHELGRMVYFSEITDFYEHSGFYALLDDKDKAYEHLRLLNQKQHFPVWIIFQLKIDPLFDSIRDETEFQQILRDVEAKYQIQHEEIRKWLEENDML
jgi:tetratricopeptide (TPR) repeat protein